MRSVLAEHKSLTNNDLMEIDTITLPNRPVITNGGVYQSKCPCCGNKQRCILDVDGIRAVFFCETADTLVECRSSKKAMVVKYAD